MPPNVRLAAGPSHSCSSGSREHISSSVFESQATSSAPRGDVGADVGGEVGEGVFLRRRVAFFRRRADFTDIISRTGVALRVGGFDVAVAQA